MAQRKPIIQRAEALSSPIHVVEGAFPYFDMENSAIARKALEVASSHFPIDPDSIQEGLKATLPCHFEVRGVAIFDVAHNPDGFAKLSQALSYHFPNRKFRFVVGLTRGKDYENCLRAILPKATAFHFVESKWGDGVHAELLASHVRLHGDTPCILHKSVKEGMIHANALLEEGEFIVVCGSFYIMAEALSVTLAPVE